MCLSALSLSPRRPGPEPGPLCERIWRCPRLKAGAAYRACSRSMNVIPGLIGGPIYRSANQAPVSGQAQAAKRWFRKTVSGNEWIPDQAGDDDGEAEAARVMPAHAPCMPRKPSRKILLIPRKRAALSRRMGGRFRAAWPILRDGPHGPPQDEGLGTKVTASGTGFPAVIPATRSARRDRGGADPAAFPHLSLSSRSSAARAGTHSFPELCEGTLRSGRNHPMRQTERRVGSGSALTLVWGDSRRRKRQEVRR